jgi:hypothetical protein
MVAKRKPIKRVKRAMPKPKQDGFDPRLVALGAGAGALYGRATNRGRAEKQVASRAAQNAAADVEMFGTGGRSAADISKSAAKSVADYEYSRMPRTDDAKLANYRGMIQQRTGEAGEFGNARRLAGLSEKDIAKYNNKVDTRNRMKYNSQTTASLLSEAGFLRAERKKTRNTVKGGVGGAALAALVQLVAKELNKK